MKLTVYLILTFLSLEAATQKMDEVIDSAYNSLINRDFNKASLLFERIIFFDTSGRYDSKTIPGLADSYFYSGHFDLAELNYQAAFKITGNVKCYYLTVIAQLKQGNFLNAKRSCLSIRDSTREIRNFKLLMLGLIDFRLGEFEDSKTSFLQVDGIDKERINLQFDLVKKMERKNKVKAVVLSGLLPGLGQAYTGHYADGLNSFLLIASFGTVYFYVVTRIGIVDAIISVLPWFQRYYVGGMNNAAHMVDEYQERQTIEYYNSLVLEYTPILRDFEL